MAADTTTHGASAHPGRPWDDLLRRARQKLDAALAVLLDARCDPGDARALLREGWVLGCRAVTGDDDGDLAALLQRAVERGVPGVRADALSGVVAALETTGEPRAVRRALMHQAHALQRVLRARRGQVWKEHGRPPGWFPWRSAVMTVLVLGVFAGTAAAVYLEPRPRESGWRAEYFQAPDLTGKSEVRREPTVAFYWHEGPPLPGWPADRWSARFDTCLDVQKAGKTVFSVGSDDGARVFVDGVKVAEDWGGHPMRFVEGAYDLKAGLHHVRVEYQELILGAALQLKVGTGDAAPETPQSWQLVMPGLGPLGARPCAGLD